MPSWNKGEVSTPDNPGRSKIMLWIRDHIGYPHRDYCLVYPFARDPSGYGHFGREGKKIYVHRFMCEARHGPPPSPKHHAAHSCDNGYGGCVNPWHLDWKTPSDNQREGKKHPRRVLTPEAVIEIRASSLPDHLLAQHYGVRLTTVQKVRLGQTWNGGNQRIFTPDEIIEIRARTWQSTKTLAEMFEVNPETIRRIQKRKSYAHVPDPQRVRGP